MDTKIVERIIVFFLGCFFILALSVAKCQNPPQPMNIVNINPAGSCQPGNITFSTQSNHLWGCNIKGTGWFDISGTAGTGTLTSISGTSPIVLTPNPITTTGTIGCPTCTVGSGTLNIIPLWTPSGTQLGNSSATQNGTTGTITFQPLTGQDVASIILGPNVASPTADIMDVYADNALTTKAFWIDQPNNNIHFRGNGFNFQEGTNASFGGIVGHSMFWSDSTAHRLLMNPNNTGQLDIVGIATAGTGGNYAKLAANGIDIVDSGVASGSGVTGNGTTNNLTKFTNGVSGVIGNAQPRDDGTNPVVSSSGWDVGITGRYSWGVPNNGTTGTTLNKMACDDGTGKAIICNHTTTTTNDPFGVAVNGISEAPGTTGNTGICFQGYCTVVFDNTATANHFAQQSTSVDGDLSDVGTTAPTNSLPFWRISTANSGAGTTGIIRDLGPSDLNSSGKGGGNVTYNGQTVALGQTGNVNVGAATGSLAVNQGNGNAITGLSTAANVIIRDCQLNFGGKDASAALTTANIQPQDALCDITAASTMTLVIVYVDAGASTVQVGYRHNGSTTAISPVLTPAAVAGITDPVACANVSGTAVTLQGNSVTCSTLTNTALAAHDVIETIGGAADATSKHMSIAVEWKIN